MSTLRDVRLSLKLSQAAFAERLGVSAETYRMWDSGRRNPPAAVLAQARANDVMRALARLHRHDATCYSC